MAFFDTLDKYELKQLGLDDGEIGALDKVLSCIPRPIRAAIKDHLVKEMKQAIKDEGVDAVKGAIKALKDVLDNDPDFIKNFKDMFKGGMPTASSVIGCLFPWANYTVPQSHRPAPKGGNSDVCGICEAQGKDTPDACRNCPLSTSSDDDDAMDHADPCTPAKMRHMHENLPRHS